MKTITKPIAFYSNDHSDSTNIFSVKVEIDEADEDLIKRCMRFMEENRGTESVKINVNATLLMETEEGEPEMEYEGNFRPECEALIIYRGGSLVYYSQSKWDSGDQIESDSFDIKELD